MKKDPARNKTIPAATQEDSLKDANRKLKGRLKFLEKENKKLKSELRQFEAVFEKTKDFLGDAVKDYSVEELIAQAKEGKFKGKKEDKNFCPDCGSQLKTLELAEFNVSICSSCSYRTKHDKKRLSEQNQTDQE